MSSSDPNFADRRLAILQQLAEIGLGMAYRLGAEREPTGETALGYQRVAKAIRHTLALEAQFSGDLEVKQRAEAQRQAQARQAAERAVFVRARDERMDAAQEIVERLIEAEPTERREDLFEDLEDWLCDSGADEIFDPERPLAELIATICKDLGITPDLTAFADQPWATEVLALPTQRWTSETSTPAGGPGLSRPSAAPPPDG